VGWAKNVSALYQVETHFPADRRPVDPTPIIQLKVMDPNGDDIVADESDESELRRPDPGPHGMTYMQSKPGS